VNQAHGRRLRRYITPFIEYGDPSIARLDDDAYFDHYSYEGLAMTFGKGDTAPVLDTFYGMQAGTLDKERCGYWMEAPYWVVDDEDDKKFLVKQPNGWHEEM
jgi:hypothetical protein